MFDLYSDYELDKIRSLGKFYQSIPDYCDIHHLSNNDFNNTLDRLKETSNKFKNKPSISTISNASREKKKNQINSATTTLTIPNIWSERNLCNTSLSSIQLRPKFIKISKSNKSSRSGIKKSYSLSHLYDDIQNLNLSNDSKSPTIKSNSNDSQNEIISENQQQSKSTNKIKTTFTKTSNKTNNVSPIIGDNKKIENENILTNYCNNSNSLKKKRKPQLNNNINNKFTFLGINIQKPIRKVDTLMKPNSNSSAPSPLYPAARLNLAATLRAEISHKKRHELNNNNNFINFRPKKNQNKFDWEVRKSPGWKSLTYCESNKDDLLYRLETRKAEQKLLRQEYRTNMELMRQRVKSAPLLLEGTTYWNSRLYNKFSHSCGSGKQSRLSVRCKYIKNNKNDIKNIENNNNQNVDSDDLSSEDRALL